MVDGRVFHKTGAAALLKARAPHRVVVFGSSSRWAPADTSARVGHRLNIIDVSCCASL